MTHWDVVDASVLPGLLGQAYTYKPIDRIGGDGAYDTQHRDAAMAARGATASIRLREG
jgi:hypothetical protein